MSQKLKVNTKTKISNLVDVQRALQDLQKNFNLLVDKVASPAEQELSETTGNTGDVQITRNKDKTYTFEVRTEDGWKTPVLGDSVIHFKGKPKTFSKKQKETISEITTRDTSTGGSEALNTIYDEKLGRFSIAHLTAEQEGGFPAPDYDSGWFSATNHANYDLTHNLDLTDVPRNVQVYTYGTDMDGPTTSGNQVTVNPPVFGTHPVHFGNFQNERGGTVCEIRSKDVLRICTGDSDLFDTAAFGNPSPHVYNDGWVRVQLWK